MPVKTADTLMAFLLSYPTFNRTRDMRLVLQSGQLSQLDLSILLLDEEKSLLPRYMTEDACKSLRILNVVHPLCDESSVSIVASILQRCHYLEEFHSKLVIDLSALSNCHQLKNLRLHLQAPFNVVEEDFYLKIVDFVQSKPNLEVFSFCNIKDGSSAYKAIATILINCPKLNSVGFVDCLDALHHIRKTRGAMMKFNLKRCFWGLNEGDVPSILRVPKSSSYSEKYPDMIQNAVHMCPTVETLVINVYHEEALEHLIHLRHLRSLSIKFNYNGADNVTTLIFLLRRIGPSLEHLSLDMDDAIPVEVIRDHCFNLKSLQIYGSTVMNDDMECHLKPLKLERLYIWKAESKSLFLLLRNSPNLIELYLGNVLCLDDEFMKTILMNNTFARLIVVGIRECLLTETGINMLLNSAYNLKELFFGILEPYRSAHQLITENHLKVLHYFDTFKLKIREFYTFRPNTCSF
ncbi:hypothetical protein AVEN_242442-1 [Araneus ventricosus]|uniref:Uncharacterized protein n=1 Tax=Araneus ventricosus TaxID=182803 RepID=A0A4Y2K7E9_ARAVE|nr:hypothetical protein AVEN_242442-1 [Araneus ventricosus]